MSASSGISCNVDCSSRVFSATSHWSWHNLFSIYNIFNFPWLVLLSREPAVKCICVIFLNSLLLVRFKGLWFHIAPSIDSREFFNSNEGGPYIQKVFKFVVLAYRCYWFENILYWSAQTSKTAHPLPFTSKSSCFVSYKVLRLFLTIFQFLVL